MKKQYKIKYYLFSLLIGIFLIEKDINAQSYSASITTSGGKTEICQNSSIAIIGQPDECFEAGVKHRWMGDIHVLSDPNISSPIFKSDKPGKFSLKYTVWSEKGDSASAEIVIMVNPLPEVNITVKGNMEKTGKRVELIADTKDNCKYQWRKDKKDIGGATEKKIKTADSGVYNVRVTDSKGCVKLSESIIKK